VSKRKNMSREARRFTAMQAVHNARLTPVKRLTGSYAEYLAEEKEKADAAIREQIELHAATLVRLRELSSLFWSRPVDQIIPEIYWDSSKDLTLNIPASCAQYERADLEDAADKWYFTMLKPTGGDFSAHGATRMRAYAEASAFHGFDMSQPAGFQAAWLHLKDDLHAFADGEVLGESHVPQVETPAEPQPKIEDIENLALESTEGRKQALAIVEGLYSLDASKVCAAWLDSLKSAWSFFPDANQIQHILAWFRNGGRNWLRYPEYDACRRSLVSQGIFPPHLLTNDEIVCAEIENEQTPLMKMGLRDKRDLKNKIMRLADPA
jgi:hypothetical protein